MKLYRGENADVWARRLVLRGWPEDLAKRVAEFAVTGDVREVPRWSEIIHRFMALKDGSTT